MSAAEEASGPAPSPAVDPTKAEALIKVCRACHTLEKDGENTIGPNLWNVYGTRAASREDFPYSPALTASRIVWTQENLDKWLTAPSSFIPGTRMAFPGIAQGEDRRLIIAWLQRHRD